ncbi:aminodeoxychorismate synthase component I [Marinicella sediminis]|uniref:Aminodeoxychorismate synthase component I n=1 Tax=Marinicella sediminis TaxID=1792834 RepID=A0ABV7J9X3_9GAMM|nr:aminodeoxychorismate synthase component I [Marinicella sediminis]
MIEQKLTEKPDFLALAAEQPGFFPALLESQSYQASIGQFDVLFAAPDVELVAFDHEQFQHLLETINCQPNEQRSLLPFQSGWLVYFSYESAYLMEPKLAHLIQPSKEPLAIAIHCQGALVYDRKNQQTWVCGASEQAVTEILSRCQYDPQWLPGAVSIEDWYEEPGQQFTAAVEQAKALIVSGDIYQANLSRQYTCRLQEGTAAVDVMARLKQANPAPFAAFLQVNDFAVVSSSPERLLGISEGWVETRPIAGTRPRGTDEQTDQALIEELINTPKEQAEHIMLIDLERNDVGKVCQIGTVEVDELMVIESYQHVHHIVSNVKGKLLPDVSVVDVIRALFPGGTITGCPKIRCMQVIHDIESRPRGCYTGSMGYINHNGQVDLNILIRTVEINGRQLTFNAGAGIVYDSQAAAELTETRHKAQGMIRALEMDAI